MLSFRPSNLPPKSEHEQEKHQAHVLECLRPMSAWEIQTEAVHELFRSGQLDLESNQFLRLAQQYGLPSGYVRERIWEKKLEHFEKNSTRNQNIKQIETDVNLTMLEMGIVSESIHDICCTVLSRICKYDPKLLVPTIRICIEIKNWNWSDLEKTLFTLIQFVDKYLSYMIPINLDISGFMLDQFFLNYSKKFILSKSCKFSIFVQEFHKLNP